MIDVEASTAALNDLRHARRHSHADEGHWIDALYRVYMSGLIATVAIFLGAGLFGDVKLNPAEQQQFLEVAIPWLGFAFACAVAIGLRSGGRGGPLTLQAATVQHELLAPIPYEVTLREPAIKQLRFLGFAGLSVGACIGALAMRRFPENPVPVIIASAVGFALVAVLSASVAMIASGRRIGRTLSNVLALAVVAWSAVDVVFKTTTSPMTLLAHLTFAGVSFDPLSLITIVMVAAAFFAALASLGGTSIDDARRRAGLVSQLRFAVTLQDIRTVVLLRRQLAQETPRGRPWIRMKRGGRTPAIWRRDWRSYFRYPITRVLRMVLLAIVAGVCLGLSYTVKPAFLIAAVALYLAGYDAVEPLAQEVDHPSRWDDLPIDHGKVLLTHLPAAWVVMVLLCLIAGASALILAPSDVVVTLLPILIVPVSVGSMTGAALSTVMGSPDVAKMMGSAGAADTMGFLLMFRLVFPPSLTVAAMAPMFALGAVADPTKGIAADPLSTVRVSNFVTYAVLLSAFSLIYIRYQKPARV